MKAEEAYFKLRSLIGEEARNIAIDGINSTKEFQDALKQLTSYKIKVYDEKGSQEDENFNKYNLEGLKLIVNSLNNIIR